jgi:arylsulfatase
MPKQTATFNFTGRNNMRSIVRLLAVFAVIATTGMVYGQDKKPNILFIMGDDIGWM